MCFPNQWTDWGKLCCDEYKHREFLEKRKKAAVPFYHMLRISAEHERDNGGFKLLDLGESSQNSFCRGQQKSKTLDSAWNQIFPRLRISKGWPASWEGNCSVWRARDRTVQGSVWGKCSSVNRRTRHFHVEWKFPFLPKRKAAAESGWMWIEEKEEHRTLRNGKIKETEKLRLRGNKRNSRWGEGSRQNEAWVRTGRW